MKNIRKNLKTKNKELEKWREFRDTLENKLIHFRISLYDHVSGMNKERIPPPKVFNQTKKENVQKDD